MDFDRQREENIEKLLKKTKEDKQVRKDFNAKKNLIEELTQDADTLYKGIVLSEILGPPISKKRRGWQT